MSIHYTRDTEPCPGIHLNLDWAVWQLTNQTVSSGGNRNCNNFSFLFPFNHYADNVAYIWWMKAVPVPPPLWLPGVSVFVCLLSLFLRGIMRIDFRNCWCSSVEGDSTQEYYYQGVCYLFPTTRHILNGKWLGPYNLPTRTYACYTSRRHWQTPRNREGQCQSHPSKTPWTGSPESSPTTPTVSKQSC